MLVLLKWAGSSRPPRFWYLRISRIIWLDGRHSSDLTSIISTLGLLVFEVHIFGGACMYV